MNKYLLLRDNKQSGPYSLEELIEKGIKAYDLIWLDGKSAAWRYPSEIEELKPYSPVVEEQPFDRFYRKNSSVEQKKEEAIASFNKTPVTQEAEPAPQQAELVISGKRKIFVTMPGNANTKPVRRTETPIAKQDEQSEPEKNAFIKSAQAGSEHKETPVQSETPKEQKEQKPVTENIYAPKTIKISVEEAPEAFSSLFQDKYSLQDEKIVDMRPQKERKSGKLAFRAIIALCLLLGGVVIGLVISYYNQKSSSRDLDALVKQIQEREKRLENSDQASLPVSFPAGRELVSQNTDSVPAQLHVSSETPSKPGNQLKEEKKQNLPAAPAADKPQDKPIAGTNNGSGNETVPVNAAAISASKNDAAIESARKNIHQLVAIEGNKYRTGVLGGISDLRLTISNNSMFQLDKVEVEIRYLGPEKKVVKTQTLLFNDISAGEQLTLEAPRTNRGVSVEYSIRSINSKELGLAHSGF
jgi:hypothetical protein